MTVRSRQLDPRRRAGGVRPGLRLEDPRVLDQLHRIVDRHSAHESAVVAERDDRPSTRVQEPVDDRDVGPDDQTVLCSSSRPGSLTTRR